MKTIKNILIFSVTFLVNSCVFDREIRLGLYEVVHIEEQGISKIIGHEEVSSKSDDYNSDYLKISLEADINLTEFLIEKRYILDVKMFFCEHPDEQVILNASGLYVNGVSIIEDYLAGIENNTNIRNGKYTYDFLVYKHQQTRYVIPEALRKNKDQVTYLLFDLKNKPQDLCFYLLGGGLIGGYNDFKSNTVVVSADQYMP